MCVVLQSYCCCPMYEVRVNRNANPAALFAGTALPKEEQTLCELIVENRRLQDLQVTLEQKERRPVTVHEWAVAAGHPSAHQLMEALQQGRRAERTMLLCHQGLVRSVAFRCARMGF